MISKIFSNTEPSIPFGYVNENACGRKLGSVSVQSSYTKGKARHFVLTKLVLDRVAELTPKNKNLYNMIWTRESALCKLRKNHRAKKLKDVFHWTVILVQSLSSSLNVDTSRFLASIDGNRKHELMGRCGMPKKVLAVAILKCSPRSYAFLQSLFPLPSKRILHSLLNTIQKMSDKVRLCCLMFDEMSIRRLTVLEVLRTFGSHGWTSNIAHHALVFMFLGLHKNWKQPGALYLICRSTKCEMPVIFLRDVLDAFKMSGLLIVATVFDTDANNVKAL
jgi:hypothetical protein